jgi:1,4-dihydroxy-2-naphthoyl-CoA synthase
MVSEIFDASEWSPVAGFDLTDITYHRHVRLGMVRVAFNRPEVRNAFRPHTVDELYAALEHARITSDVGVVLLTGNGPSPKDAGWAFCSGGDQRIRGDHGYRYEVAGASAADAPKVPDLAKLGRLHILEVQRLIRFMPKVVIAVVPGWAAGGEHADADLGLQVGPDVRAAVACVVVTADAAAGRERDPWRDVGARKRCRQRDEEEAGNPTHRDSGSNRGAAGSPRG